MVVTYHLSPWTQLASESFFSLMGEEELLGQAVTPWPTTLNSSYPYMALSTAQAPTFAPGSPEAGGAIGKEHC